MQLKSHDTESLCPGVVARFSVWLPEHLETLFTFTTQALAFTLKKPWNFNHALRYPVAAAAHGHQKCFVDFLCVHAYLQFLHRPWCSSCTLRWDTDRSWRYRYWISQRVETLLSYSNRLWWIFYSPMWRSDAITPWRAFKRLRSAQYSLPPPTLLTWSCLWLAFDFTMCLCRSIYGQLHTLY